MFTKFRRQLFPVDLPEVPLKKIFIELKGFANNNIGMTLKGLYSTLATEKKRSSSTKFLSERLKEALEIFVGFQNNLIKLFYN